MCLPGPGRAGLQYALAAVTAMTAWPPRQSVLGCCNTHRDRHDRRGRRALAAAQVKPKMIMTLLGSLMALDKSRAAAAAAAAAQ